MEVARDKRKEYADRIRQMADLVEKSSFQPTACKVFVFWDDLSCTRLGKTEAYSVPMLMSGVLHNAAMEMAAISYHEPMEMENDEN